MVKHAIDDTYKLEFVKRNEEQIDEFRRFLHQSKCCGNIEEKWLILKSNQAVIGLFEGMIDKNTLTFKPGWSQEG